MHKIWNLPAIEFMPFSEIEEKRPVFLVTNSAAWESAGTMLQLNIEEQVEPATSSIKNWDNLKAKFKRKEGEVVYAIGDGMVTDAAKYLALNFGLPLIVLPTALSMDTFLTSTSSIHKKGCVEHLETKSPEKLIIDLEVITSSPVATRTGAICDLLSIATACWDWEFAQVNGKNPSNMPFIPWVHENAMSILRGALDCAEAAGEGDHQGLKQMLDILCLEVQLCNQLSHTRLKEGTEHYFAYAVENYIEDDLSYSDFISTGILVAAGLQDQDPTDLESALRLCNVPLDRISGKTIDKTLRELPSYCRKHGLAYGVAHDLDNLVG
jgi:glycerol-1-phosphate dehydrogenase [NAD(P)+]